MAQLHHPSILTRVTPSEHTRDWYIHVNTAPVMGTEFWNRAKCPPSGKWIKKCMHTQWAWFHCEGEQNYALFRTLVQLEILITRKLDQTQNDKDHVFPQLWVLGFTQIHKFHPCVYNMEVMWELSSKTNEFNGRKRGDVGDTDRIHSTYTKCLYEICYVEWIDTNLKYFLQ